MKFFMKALFVVLLPFVALWYVVKPRKKAADPAPPTPPAKVPFSRGEVITTEAGPMVVLGEDEKGTLWCRQMISAELEKRQGAVTIYFVDPDTTFDRTGVVLCPQELN